MRKSRKRLKVGKTIRIYGVDILTLHEKKCIPCEGGIPPLTVEEIKPYMEQIDQEWKSVLDHHIERTFTFDDFQTALDLSMKQEKYVKMRDIMLISNYHGGGSK